MSCQELEFHRGARYDPGQAETLMTAPFSAGSSVVAHGQFFISSTPIQFVANP